MLCTVWLHLITCGFRSRFCYQSLGSAWAQRHKIWKKDNGAWLWSWEDLFYAFVITIWVLMFSQVLTKALFCCSESACWSGLQRCSHQPSWSSCVPWAGTVCGRAIEEWRCRLYRKELRASLRRWPPSTPYQTAGPPDTLYLKQVEERGGHQWNREKWRKRMKSIDKLLMDKITRQQRPFLAYPANHTWQIKIILHLCINHMRLKMACSAVRLYLELWAKC